MLRLALTHVESRAIADQAVPLIHTPPRARHISYSGSGDRCTAMDDGYYGFKSPLSPRLAASVLFSVV